MLDIMKSQLEHTGHFTVDVAESAHTALEQLSKKRYDAILSDYQMPGMDGIDFLKTLRASGNDIPFIIFTGRGRENVVIDALNFGADFYLQKGIDFKSLFAELQNMIEKAVERKSLKGALEESEARYRDVFRTSRDSIFICSPDGKWIDFNDAMLKLSGYETREEFFQVPVPLVYAHGEDHDILKDLVIRNDYVEDYLVHGRKKDGTIVDVLVTTVPVRNPDGSVKVFIGTIRDVTEQRRAEQSLKESEAKLRALFEYSLDAIFLTIPDGRILAANPAACQLVGYTEEEICRGGRNMILDQTDPRLYKALEERRRNGRARAEMNFVHRNGMKILCEVSSNIFTDSAGNQMTSMIVRDITQRKIAETELRESEERYRTLMENAPVGILTCDRSGQITYLNPKVIEMLGSPGQEKTKEINLLSFPILVKVGFSDCLRRTLETGVPEITKEAEYTSKWGKTAYIRTHISPIWNHGSVKGAQIILDDITLRERAADTINKEEIH